MGLSQVQCLHKFFYFITHLLICVTLITKLHYSHLKNNWYLTNLIKTIWNEFEFELINGLLSSMVCHNSIQLKWCDMFLLTIQRWVHVSWPKGRASASSSRGWGGGGHIPWEPIRERVVEDLVGWLVCLLLTNGGVWINMGFSYSVFLGCFVCTCEKAQEGGGGGEKRKLIKEGKAKEVERGDNEEDHFFLFQWPLWCSSHFPLLYSYGIGPTRWVGWGPMSQYGSKHLYARFLSAKMPPILLVPLLIKISLFKLY